MLQRSIPILDENHLKSYDFKFKSLNDKDISNNLK